MCTVSVVAHRTGVRLICNRDELRTRPEAIIPKECRVGSGRALFPRDPLGGGTWIGVNQSGLIATLLNRSDGDARSSDTQLTTRGAIVPQLLESQSIDRALAQAIALPSNRFSPFRIVLVQGHVMWTVTGGGGHRAVVRGGRLSAPRVVSSSALGDGLVEGPRRRLFDQLLARYPGRPLKAQAMFHRHQWRRRLAISVLMSRQDARTVSRTEVDVNFAPEWVGMLYQPLPESPRLAGLGHKE